LFFVLMRELHISISAEKIGYLFGIPITNSILTTWFVMAFLVVLSYIATKNLSLVPSGFQTIVEMAIGGLHDFFRNITGNEKINRFFPLIATIFIFVIISNWSGLLPGVGSIGFKNNGVFTPLLKGTTADLNTTFAIAIVAVGSFQYFGIKELGLSYFKKFINFKSPIAFFIGLLDIVSEISKVISFAFRLFGNIFAGEVLLAVIGSLIPLIAPLPFLGLEVFVGFIQALVFSMLTAVFLNMAVTIETHD